MNRVESVEQIFISAELFTLFLIVHIYEDESRKAQPFCAV